MGDEPVQPPPPARSLIAGILTQRCPRCREGHIFAGIIAMNDPCPVCRLVFAREPGYFTGAMYFSYGLSVFILLPLYFLLKHFMPEVTDTRIVLLALVIYSPLIPVVFRYSRVFWIYFDREL